jgi:cyclophilin family peptidyl-prolyl cis-trans isomerase
MSRFAVCQSFGRLMFVGLVLGSGFFSSAQEKEAEPKKSAPQETTTASSNAAAQFDAKLKEWKDIIRKLRDLTEQYRLADEKEAAKIEADWSTTIIEGRNMIPQLRDLGIQAYQEAPNEDFTLTKFLAKLLDDELSHDRYESALELAQVLIDNNSGFDLNNAAATAAFSLDDFDVAEKYLQQAEEEDELNSTTKEMLAQINNYKEWWQAEQEIRKKEAEADDLPRVKLTTSKGEIVLELFENEAPQTVANFISLVDKGFYNELTFHRVLAGFMAQGGDPTGTGSGGPGYHIYCECHKENFRRHFRGSISMAHAGRDSGGSQFFLMFAPKSHLDGRHTVFGRIIDGMDVLAKIQRRDPDAEPPLPKPDEIVKAEVIRKRDHEYVPTKVED